jgi:hypothetical protein
MNLETSPGFLEFFITFPNSLSAPLRARKLSRKRPQSDLEMDIIDHNLKVRCEPKADVK